jgi:hypothetical protein
VTWMFFKLSDCESEDSGLSALGRTPYNVGIAHEFADEREIVVDCRDCERLMALRIGVYCYAASC